MDSADHEKKRFATADEIRSAIEALTVEEFGRLRRAASAFLYGSEYKDPLELMNEAIVRTMRGAGEKTKGRHWPLHVPFVAFLIETMRSVANASVDSRAQTETDYLVDLVPQGMALHDVEVTALRAPSTERVCEDEEQQAAEKARAAAVASAIEDHFADDDDVLMLVLCLREGHRPREIQDAAGMTLTQYNTARRRFSRGLAKLGFRGKKP